MMINTVILRMVFPQIVFCNSGEFCLAVDCAFLIADVVAERNLSHIFLPDFTLKQCGYHLGSAIDDNPLAVLSKSMFHCLRQYCGGSPRVSSEMCFQPIGNSFPAVLCLFYWQSFYFCPSLLSLSVSNIRIMLNCISAVSGGQLTLFKVIAFFKFTVTVSLHFIQPPFL